MAVSTRNVWENKENEIFIWRERKAVEKLTFTMWRLKPGMAGGDKQVGY